MLCLSILSTALTLVSFPLITFAATIRTADTIASQNYPNINLTSARNLLDALARTDRVYPYQPLPFLRTNNPWPTAPFDFPSPDYRPWSMRIRSYEPLGRLTFRQIHAAISLCIDASDKIIQDYSPTDRMPAETYVFRASKTRPYDLTREDVEVAILNEADVPGKEYTAREMLTAVNVLLDAVLPRELRDMPRAIVHYAVMEPRLQDVGYKEVRLRRKTQGVGEGAAVATS
ncbi:MAG: hypothetical protein LQ352_004651 [Teloschistes flavicans]|nr:MAG: hypothetical protein LQ352_004651 [Teloschistes flavicans]